MVIARMRSFFSHAPRREAQELYIALVRQSRNPFFYTDCAVPDTLDGRFEILVLHVFLALRALKAQGGREELSRLLQESLFDDMDQSLREMGVGDMGVGRRVKAMSKAAYGRREAYTQAFASDDALREALKRNVYRGEPVPEAAVAGLLAYLREEAAKGLAENAPRQ
jgi:cytochrome b pre-mRNA-processing protein 3